MTRLPKSPMSSCFLTYGAIDKVRAGGHFLAIFFALLVMGDSAVPHVYPSARSSARMLLMDAASALVLFLTAACCWPRKVRLREGGIYGNCGE